MPRYSVTLSYTTWRPTGAEKRNTVTIVLTAKNRDDARKKAKGRIVPFGGTGVAKVRVSNVAKVLMRGRK